MTARSRLMAIALFMPLITPDARASDPVPQGRWYVPSRDVTVALGPCAGSPQQVCGTVVEVGSKFEALSDDFKRRAQGMKVVHELKLNGAGRWEGRLFDPFKEVFCALSIAPLETGDIVARTCIFMDMFCTVERWPLVAAPRDPAPVWRATISERSR